MNLDKLIKLIEQWAIDRGIDKNGTVEGQFFKTAEEAAELTIGISKDDIDVIKDSIGDVFVTLVVGNMIDNRFDIYSMYLEAISRKERHLDFERIQTRLRAKLKGEKSISIGYLSSIPFWIYCYGYDQHWTTHTIDMLDTISEYYGLKLEECVEYAYHEIADRKGRVIDGTFVKEEDLNE